MYIADARDYAPAGGNCYKEKQMTFLPAYSSRGRIEDTVNEDIANRLVQPAYLL